MSGLLLLLVGLALLGAAVALLLRARGSDADGRVGMPGQGKAGVGSGGAGAGDVGSSEAGLNGGGTNEAGFNEAGPGEPVQSRATHDEEHRGGLVHGAPEQSVRKDAGDDADDVDDARAVGGADAGGDGDARDSEERDRGEKGDISADGRAENGGEGDGDNQEASQEATTDVSTDASQVDERTDGGEQATKESHTEPDHANLNHAPNHAKAEPRPEPPRTSSGFDFMKRRRKQWALDNGCAYDREDKAVAAQWPISIIGHSATVPTVRDMISGFFEGHQTHIGDIGEYTILAMRRSAGSPVRVHYSKAGAMPQGMRRTSLLDQPPFFSYATDVRALDRMLDSRLEDALAALSQVADDIAWEDNWVAVRMSKRLELSVWKAIIPHVRDMADAAMVLPPYELNIPLDLIHADQTRPMPGGPLVIEPGTKGVERTVAEALAGAEDSDDGYGADYAGQGDTGRAGNAGNAGNTGNSRPAYIRAVPDAVSNSVSDAVSNGESNVGTSADPDSGSTPSDHRDPSSSTDDSPVAHAEVPTADRPDITRPAEPVSFPTRANARWEDAEADFDDFPVAASSEEIPSLGEDPEHTGATASRRPRVIRVDIDEEATIFDDPAEDADDLDSDEETLSHEARRRRGGRHRAPEARHARPDPIEAVEYETVDGEIIDD